MPIVPTSRQSQFRVVDPTEGINPTNLAMAAAMMHSEGRLFNPIPLGPNQAFEKSPNQRVSEGHEAVTRKPALFGERGDDQLYLDKQDKYQLGKVT